MSYLKFDKNLLINLEQSLKLEILRTNKSGAYHCTSVVDCNTRKYHGLLVMPVPALDDDNHVLLSALHETVVQHDVAFNLGIHKYSGDNFSPKGHKYIREFDCESVPKTIYRVGGVVLSKEKLLVSYENRIIIKYTLLDAHSPTTLHFKPFLAFRNVSQLTSENNTINKSYQEIENGVSVCLYPGYPCLQMQFSKAPSFAYAPDWYRGVEYTKEMERGFPFKEDLYAPGHFEIPIKKGESIYFSAGDTLIDTKKIKQAYAKELKSRTHRTSFTNSLINSAQQFQLKSGDNLYLLAGYPWFKVRARDQVMALPGLTLGVDDVKSFENIMRSNIEALTAFMEHGTTEGVIKEINAPDVLLWTIWALQQFAVSHSTEKCNKKYAAFIEATLNYIRSGGHPNLALQPNGLLWSNGADRPISWMNSTLNGRPIVPRNGYLVEFNALWYNALLFAAHLAEARGDRKEAAQYSELAVQTGSSFKEMFLNEHGYLFDYVDSNQERDYSVRPNMVIALALQYSPLSRTERKKVLDFVTRELVTPKGIRSLSPKSEGYNPYCSGNYLERDLAYHQGAAWPWLIGPYLEAYHKIFGLSGVSFMERMLIGFEEEMSNHCIGSIAELFDGNPPFEARGAISYALNVAAILRIKTLLKTINQ